MSMFSIIYIGAQQNNPHGADLRFLYKISKGKEMQKKRGGGGECDIGSLHSWAPAHLYSFSYSLTKDLLGVHVKHYYTL